MKQLLRLALIAAVVVLSPSVSFASMTYGGAKCTLSLTKAYTPSPWTREFGYVDQVKEKFIFGGKNTLLGWLELYNEPRDAVRTHQNVAQGLGRGLLNTIGDTVGGVLHLATFPITTLDLPLPEGGTDVL